MKEVVIGVFRRVDTARQALESLLDLGLSQQEIIFAPATAASPSDVAHDSLGGAELAYNLIAIGVPEREAVCYRDELARGRSIIAVDGWGYTQDLLQRLGEHEALERATFRVIDTYPADPQMTSSTTIGAVPGRLAAYRGTPTALTQSVLASRRGTPMMPQMHASFAHRRGGVSLPPRT